MKTILLTLLSLIIYDLGKKITKILIIKWNKKKLDLIISEFTKDKKMQEIDKDYWGVDKWT